MPPDKCLWTTLLYAYVFLVLVQAALVKRRYEEHSNRSTPRRAAGDGAPSESPPPTSARSPALRTPAALVNWNRWTHGPRLGAVSARTRTHTADLRSRHSSLHEIAFEYYCELASGSPLVDLCEAGLLCHVRQWPAPALIRSPPGSTQ